MGACFLLGVWFGAPAEAQSQESAGDAGASSVKSSYEPAMSAELPPGVSGGFDSPAYAAKAATVSRDTLVTVADLYRRLGAQFEILGQYDSAQMQLKEVIAIDERLYGADHQAIIVDLTRLGALYYRSGRYNDAAQTLSRALVMAESAFGAEQKDLEPILASEGNSDREMERCSMIIRKLHAVITHRAHAAPKASNAWSQPPFR